MNIFYLSPDPLECAIMHADKHCIKMIVEYAQLLSTSHRVLDGLQSVGKSPSGRKTTYWALLDGPRHNKLYKATHINHPSAVWARQSRDNYAWLWSLLQELCKEYTYRYGKIHKVEREGLLEALRWVPSGIAEHPNFTEPTPAMPDDVKIKGDSIASYRNYYISKKQHLASWRGKVNSRNIPTWFRSTNAVI